MVYNLLSLEKFLVKNATGELSPLINHFINSTLI